MAPPGVYMRALMDRQLQRTINPNWMAEPDSWNWPLAVGHPPVQGWGRTWRDNPGLANLLWLVMDADKPPVAWCARDSTYYTAVVATSSGPLRPVVELAALNALETFVPKLEALLRQKHDPLPAHLAYLAKRRLACAH